VQFATSVGGVYFYDFGSHSATYSLAKIVLDAHQAHQQAGGTLPETHRKPSMPRAIARRASNMSAEDAAAAASMARKQALARKQSARASMGKALCKIAEGSTVRTMLKAQLEAEREVALSERFHDALKTAFTQVLSSSLAHEPRALKTTIEVATAYGISPVDEADYLWLADLAQSLPTPIGWIQLETYSEGRPVSYWHNELLGASQWNHPIDEFVKCTLKALRQPLHPICTPQLQAMFGPNFNPLIHDPPSV